MPKEVTAEEVRRLMRERDDLVILDVLSPESYERRHLPRAVNVPESSGDFETNVRSVAPSKDAPIVAYCSDADCEAGPRAARRLEELGYHEVYEFRDGLEGWQQAGERFDGTGRLATKRVRADVGVAAEGA
jgi:rhodanese-related sulfurtransferase